MVKKLRVGGTVSRVGTLFSSHALGGSVYYMRKKCNSLFAGGGGRGGGGMVHSPRTGKYMRMDYFKTFCKSLPVCPLHYAARVGHVL